MNVRLHYYGVRCPNDTKIPISLGADGGRLFGHGLGSLTVRLSIIRLYSPLSRCHAPVSTTVWTSALSFITPDADLKACARCQLPVLNAEWTPRWRGRSRCLLAALYAIDTNSEDDDVALCLSLSVPSSTTLCLSLLVHDRPVTSIVPTLSHLRIGECQLSSR